MTRKLATIALAALALALGAPEAKAQAPSFVAEVSPQEVAPGQSFLYQVALTFANQNVSSFRPPDFKGFRVLHAPAAPNRSTQMQIGGGGTFIQNTLSWQFELAPTGTQKGAIGIGPARVTIDGRDLKSNYVTVHVGTGGQGRSAAPAPAAPRGMFPFATPPGFGPPTPPPDRDGDAAPPLASAPAANFIRVVPDKTRVHVGEQVTVSWYLYLTQGMDKYETITEPHMDAFWTEDVTPPAGARGQLSVTREVIDGRVYQIATLFKKALFPLRAGKLSISPLEARIAQVDFFGTALRTQRLKSEPTTIEVSALPASAPSGFETPHVGKLALTARADRDKVSVGEAITLTVEVSGSGNIRNSRPPKLPRLEGWKVYEPKVTVDLQPGETVSGAKRVEYLLLPDRPGTTTVPALELVYFDPETNRYAVDKSEPITLQVTADGTSPQAPAAAGHGAASAGSGVENVIGAEVRPIRARATLRRDLGATFYRSQAFWLVLLVPPLALLLTGFAARIRVRLALDTERVRRRRMRQAVRRHLRAAERHRDELQRSAFYIEIDRVLREVLTERLGRPVAGLRMDELGELMTERGLPPELVQRVIRELEQCDLARFAPGTDPAGDELMTATLERAEELLMLIQKRRLKQEVSR